MDKKPTETPKNKLAIWKRDGVSLRSQGVRNKPKENSFVGNPDATRAVITAHGPGIGKTRISASTHALTCGQVYNRPKQHVYMVLCVLFLQLNCF